jgi:hypothetical protein
VPQNPRPWGLQILLACTRPPSLDIFMQGMRTGGAGTASGRAKAGRRVWRSSTTRGATCTARWVPATPQLLPSPADLPATCACRCQLLHSWPQTRWHPSTRSHICCSALLCSLATPFRAPVTPDMLPPLVLPPPHKCRRRYWPARCSALRCRVTASRRGLRTRCSTGAPRGRVSELCLKPLAGKHAHAPPVPR